MLPYHCYSLIRNVSEEFLSLKILPEVEAAIFLQALQN